jgi:hypothetical protein
VGVTLKYIQGANSYSQYFVPLSAKGWDAMDEIEFFPAVQQKLLDGKETVQNAGFRRIFTIDLGVITDSSLLLYLVNFAMGGLNLCQQFIDSGDGLGFVSVVLENAQTQLSDWLDGVQFAKHIVLRLHESIIRTTWPGGSPSPDTPDTSVIMYWLANKQITGTPESPQTITFNGTDASGATIPVANSSYVYLVKCEPLQDCIVSVVQGSIVTTPGNYITVQVCHSDAGLPSGDGNFYSDIILFVKAKT